MASTFAVYLVQNLGGVLDWKFISSKQHSPSLKQGNHQLRRQFLAWRGIVIVSDERLRKRCIPPQLGGATYRMVTPCKAVSSVIHNLHISSVPILSISFPKFRAENKHHGNPRAPPQCQPPQEISPYLEIINHHYPLDFHENTRWVHQLRSMTSFPFEKLGDPIFADGGPA